MLPPPTDKLSFPRGPYSRGIASIFSHNSEYLTPPKGSIPSVEQVSLTLHTFLLDREVEQMLDFIRRFTLLLRIFLATPVRWL